MEAVNLSQPTVSWSDGSRSSARTWEALEQAVRKAQWHRWSEDDFREVMQKRAWRWSRTRISIDGNAAEFFAELERARLVAIESDTAR